MERKTSDRDRESESNSDRQRDRGQESSSLRAESGSVASLHRTVGNQAIQRLYDEGELQATLTVSQPNDPHEREAKQVADQVMRMFEPESYSGEGVEINKKAASNGSNVEGEARERIDSVKGGGKQLPPSTRSFFEQRFGRDFSDVRVHTDASADQAARSINAEAFTYGKEVVFRSDTYDPNSRAGRELLAHELTHVVQQTGPSTDETRSTAIQTGSVATVQRQEEQEQSQKVGSGETGQFEPMRFGDEDPPKKKVDEAVDEIKEEANTAVGKFEEQLEDVANDFKSYAEPKIAESKAQISPAEFFSLIADGAFAALGATIGGGAGAAVGMWAAQTVKDAIMNKAAEASKQATDWLTSTMNKIVEGIKNGAASVRNNITAKLETELRQNYKGVIVDAGPQLRQRIMTDLGVPHPDKDYYTPLLKKLIAKFRTVEWQTMSDLQQGVIHGVSQAENPKQSWIKGGAESYTQQSAKSKGYDKNPSP